MKAAKININIVENYLTLLSGLSRDNKLELISKLSESLKTGERKRKKDLSSLYGALKTEQTAEEILAEIKNSRNFSREEVDL
jgi:hypothetical protein